MESEEEFYAVMCRDCVMVLPFKRTDEGAAEAVKWSRAHTEGTGHTVMIPFKVYERVGGR